MHKNRSLAAILVLIFTLLLMAGCGATGDSDSTQQPAPSPDQQKELSGELVIYHAGSLTIPFDALEKEFESLHPKVDIKRTAGGSREIARKVAELGDKVDILASADYTVIDTLLIPDHAKWNALFAKNSMVIMYTDRSKYADEITAGNWYDVLLREGVNYGHSEPDLDPCGYRTLLVWQLAEKFYNRDGLYQQLSDSCPAKNIRPKSVELISLLETGALDYAFEYESVARQHAAKNPVIKYVKLPENINLSSMEYTDFYKSASVKLKGKKPGEIITKTGEPIVYSLTMPDSGQNKALAIEFLKFFFDRDKGLKILEDNGQPTLEKVQVKGEENLPGELSSALH